MTREDINDIINAICPNDEDYEKPCISPKYLRRELEQLALDQKQWNGESTTKNNLGVDCISRQFQEIVVEYPPEDLCTYPEYKGKPYFSIKYKEGNDYIIGYGTYNPEVLSRYLRDYFMPSVTPQEPRWIPVSERLPEELLGVLVYCPTYDNIYCAYLEKGEWKIFSKKADEKINEVVVAWQSLPEHYKMVEEQGENT